MSEAMNILCTPKKQLALASVGQLILNTTGPGPIENSEWDVYLDLSRRLTRNNPTSKAILQYSPHQAPTLSQRRKMRALEGELRVSRFEKVALLSESSLVRSTVTAIGWMSARNGGHQLKAFRPRAWCDCLQWLRQSAAFNLESAEEALEELVKTVGYPGLHSED